MKEYNDIEKIDFRKDSIIRELTLTDEGLLTLIELLVSVCRGYREVKDKSRTEEEALFLLHFLADHWPIGKYPYRLDTIKNSLWTDGVGARNRWLEIRELDRIENRKR